MEGHGYIERAIKLLRGSIHMAIHLLALLGLRMRVIGEWNHKRFANGMVSCENSPSFLIKEREHWMTCVVHREFKTCMRSVLPVELYDKIGYEAELSLSLSLQTTVL